MQGQEKISVGKYFLLADSINLFKTLVFFVKSPIKTIFPLTLCVNDYNR